MSATALNPSHLDREQLGVWDQIVRNGFGVESLFWLQKGETWYAIHAPADDRRFSISERDPPGLCAALNPGSRVCIETLGDEGCVEVGLEMPPLRGERLLAVVRLATTDVRLLERLANLIAGQCSNQSHLDRIDIENRGLLHQVTHDLEELAFLRHMAELLEISDLSFDMPMMAEAILPTLRPLCEAEALVMVASRSSGEDDSAEVEVDAPTLWCGPRIVDDVLCVRLVEQFREQCLPRPVVRNRWQSGDQGDRFPGVASFILVPIVNSEKVIGWLLALNRVRSESSPDDELPWEVSYREFGTNEATLMSSSAAILATHSRNVELFREREELLVSMVRALVSAIEAKDEYTRGHSERVARYAARLARELGMNEDFCERLYLTGLLHDIGKIGVRDAVLSKQGPLNDPEFQEIKQHVEKGWAILQDLTPLSYVLPGVLHHHEELDGTGYPDGLSGQAIPLAGRILAVADAYDAMTSDRPYRPGMPQARAVEILQSGAGTQWDAEIVQSFLRILPEIQRIKQNYVPRTPTVRRAAIPTM